MRRFSAHIGFIMMVVIALLPAAIQAKERRVAVELMIAIDVSDSINKQELQFQIDGIVKAFRNKKLIGRIEALSGGGLAVAVMFWAGTNEQRTMINWRRVHNKATSLAFAQALSDYGASPWSGNLFTALGNALHHAYIELTGNKFRGERLVVDVSSDDPHNKGLPVVAMREKLIAEGIVINGLPILAGRNEHEERKRLIDYYRNEVIGGPGSFLVPALSKADYARAMLKKLISEIAGLPLKQHSG